MKKLVSDFTLKRVLVLCGIVTLVGSILGYLVGWSLGMNCGQELGRIETLEEAIVYSESNDDMYYIYLPTIDEVHEYVKNVK